MVIEASALLAILLGEPERDAFMEAIVDAEDPVISAATLLEASMLMESKAGTEGVAMLDDFLAASGVRCIALDDIQARVALEGFHRYGKGRSPAGLNFGDCFSYGLAMTHGRPLLFKGDDFRQTNVKPAVPGPRATDPC